MANHEKPIISFRITAELKAALQKLANADHRPLSSYITLVLREHVAEHGKSAPRGHGKPAGKTK